GPVTIPQCCRRSSIARQPSGGILSGTFPLVSLSLAVPFPAECALSECLKLRVQSKTSSRQAELTFIAFFAGTGARPRHPVHCVLSRNRLSVRIERHANRGVTQQFLHDFQFRTGRSKQRRIRVTKSMPANSFGDSQLPRNGENMAVHDLLC